MPGLDFKLFRLQNTGQVLMEIHKFSNLNFMNMPKINMSTRSQYKACWPSWKLMVGTSGPAVKSIPGNADKNLHCKHIMSPNVLACKAETICIQMQLPQ